MAANLPAEVKSQAAHKPQKSESWTLIEKNGSCTSFSRRSILLSLWKCKLKSGDFGVVLLVLVCVWPFLCVCHKIGVTWMLLSSKLARGAAGQHRSGAAAVPGARCGNGWGLCWGGTTGEYFYLQLQHPACFQAGQLQAALRRCLQQVTGNGTETNNLHGKHTFLSQTMNYFKCPKHLPTPDLYALRTIPYVYKTHQSQSCNTVINVEIHTGI